jgi:hypothetical protein
VSAACAAVAASKAKRNSQFVRMSSLEGKRGAKPGRISEINLRGATVGSTAAIRGHVTAYRQKSESSTQQVPAHLRRLTGIESAQSHGTARASDR